jgi:hypothetical protein
MKHDNINSHRGIHLYILHFLIFIFDGYEV